MLPLGEARDELAHLTYVRHVATELRLTVVGEPGSSVLSYESHQPPLFYVLAAGLYRWTGANPLTVRLLPAVIGAVTVPIAFSVARLAAGTFTAWAVALFFAFQPTQVAFTSVINHDGLGVLLAIGASGALFAFLHRPQRGMLVVAAVLAGLTVWVKSSFVAVWPAVLLGLWCGRDRVRNWRRSAADSVWFVVVATAVALPWWIRNAMLYGDPLAMSAFTALFPPARLPAAVPRLSWHTPVDLFFSYWAIFGRTNNVRIARWIYAVASEITLVATIGVARTLRRHAAVDERTKWLVAWALASFVVNFAMNTPFVVLYNQPQGRYLFSTLFQASLLVALGLREQIGRFTIPAVALLFVFDLWIWTVDVPGFLVSRR